MIDSSWICRKVTGQAAYPRYEKIKPTVEKEWKKFCEFLKEATNEEPVVNQCEVTYVNHLERGKGWESYGDLHRIAACWTDGTSGEFLPEPEKVRITADYVIPENKGRLHVALQPAIRRHDAKEVLQLTLTARGRPAASQADAIAQWFEVGHEWIVRGFTDFYDQGNAHTLETHRMITSLATTHEAIPIPSSRERSFEEPTRVQWSDIIPADRLSAWQIHAIIGVLNAARLSHDWDSYRSPPPAKHAVESALSLLTALDFDDLPLPHVTPVSGGGIQIEWTAASRDLELEILPDGSLEFLKTEGGQPVEEGRLALLSPTPTRQAGAHPAITRALLNWLLPIGEPV